MSLSKTTKLGIVACPGGEAFVDEMLPQLKHLYMKKFDRMASALSKRYKITKEDVIQQMNMAHDLSTGRFNHNGATTSFSCPRFKLPVEFTRFANGEFKAKVKSSVRGMDIFIVQDVENHYPIRFPGSDEEHLLSVNDHIFCLFVTIHAVIQAGAESVTLVLPSYPYSRQHKKKGREALTAALFGQMVERMGVDRVITLDIHSKEIENSFGQMSLENLHASYQIIRKLSTLVDLENDDMVVVSPDTGAVDRNKFYAGNLNKPLAMLYKERDYSRTSRNAGDTNITNARLLGDVDGKVVFMADDMLGTGGTLIKAMRLLKEMGATKIICAISLPLFTGEAIEHFDAAYKEGLFYRIIGTNAVYHDEQLLSKEWFVSTNIANLFSRIMIRLHHGRSTSPLLDNSQIIQKMLKS